MRKKCLCALLALCMLLVLHPVPALAAGSEAGAKSFTAVAGTGKSGGYSGCPRDSSCPAYSFTDLNLNRWYHDGIHFCVERKWMVGTGENTFSPGESTSRAMVAALLWRIQGSPAVSDPIQYRDVPQGAWYAEAVRWATSTGIVTGYGDGSFGPGDPITRQQLATLLYRYEKQFGGGGFGEQWMFVLDFADRDEISQWACEALCWMTMHHVIEGKDGNLLAPNSGATRAETAAMLQRYIQAAE